MSACCISLYRSGVGDRCDIRRLERSPDEEARRLFLDPAPFFLCLEVCFPPVSFFDVCFFDVRLLEVCFLELCFDADFFLTEPAGAAFDGTISGPTAMNATIRIDTNERKI
jgi:hypothetical protein